MQSKAKAEELVHRFYDEIWNARDSSRIEQILAVNVSFRGSLGTSTNGIPAFQDYVDNVHAGLSNYICEIQSLVADDRNVAGRMLFTGLHDNEFMGFMPTGSDVNWSGAAFFNIENELIHSIWVLGDLKSLYDQLAY